jgi:DnaJ-class molecular chaperone
MGESLKPCDNCHGTGKVPPQPIHGDMCTACLGRAVVTLSERELKREKAARQKAAYRARLKARNGQQVAD